MSCPAYITDLATNVWSDLGQPTGQPPPYIQSKLVSQSYVGQLNNLIATCYISVSGDISPPLDNTEQGIYSLLYQYNYYTTALNRTLAGLNPGVVSMSDGDSRIVFVNPVDIARIYRDAKQQVYDNLVTQVYAYRQMASQPKSVDFPFIVNDLGISSNISSSAPYNYYRS